MSKGQKIGVFLIFVIVAFGVLFVVFTPSPPEEDGADARFTNELAVIAGDSEDGTPDVAVAGVQNVVDGAPTDALSVEVSGNFFNGAHNTSGAVRIEEKNGQKILIFADDFTTEDGPDLHVYLAGVQNPQSSADLHAEGDVDLGALTNVDGAQEYVIPNDLDFDPASVVVYCVPFKVVFGYANLNK